MELSDLHKKRSDQNLGNPKQICLSQEAWSKLVAMCHAGETEVAGFGISWGVDPLYIDEFRLVKHEADSAWFEFDDDALANFQAEMFADDIYPDQCRRVYMHTHPGDSAIPSGMDWTNFDEHFANMDWAIMLILARGGETKAILRIRTVPSAHEGSSQLPMYVDKELSVVVDGQVDLGKLSFAAADFPYEEWEQEYQTCCVKKKWVHKAPSFNGGGVRDYRSMHGGGVGENGGYYGGYRGYQGYENKHPRHEDSPLEIDKNRKEREALEQAEQADQGTSRHLYPQVGQFHGVTMPSLTKNWDSIQSRYALTNEERAALMSMDEDDAADTIDELEKALEKRRVVVT